MLADYPKLELRDRQKTAVARLFAAFRSNHGRVLLVMPTGAGKRYIAVYLCQLAIENRRRVLFVTNRRLLVEQMFEEAKKFGLDYGVIMANTPAGDRTAPVQIASIQTVESWHLRPEMGSRIGDGLPQADLIIIDEAHQDVERYQSLLAHYPDAKVVALTATPVGTDGTILVPPYDLMVEGCLNTELIGDGLLLPTKVYAPSEPNIEGVKIVKRQEYNQKALGKAVAECTVFADVFNEWSLFADRKTVCFVPGVAYGNDLVSQFNRRLGAGSAYMISAKTTQDERKYAFDAVKAGDAKVLVSVDVLKEGWDMPQISCGIDLQPNSQLRTYWQKIGRAKRAYEGQSDAVWLDFAGNYWKFPHPDTDPEWPTDKDETTQDVIERNRKKDPKEPQPIMCPKCAFVRERGPKCPQCGHECGEPIRRVRMGNGKLKDIPAIAKAKIEKSAEHRALDKWKSQLYAGLNAGLSLQQCAIRHRHITGDWPKEGWPGTYEREAVDWKNKVSDVFDSRSITIQCKQYMEAQNVEF